ncbi:MAG: SDR family oxidoreductase [Phycisphaerae bacterium]|nr:SDR family oxidoreductase [Phycisphaerae bacterium]
MSNIEDKIIFITGVGSGIGRATTLKLLAAGAKVFGMSRTQAKLDRLEREAASDRLGVSCGDVRNEPDVQAAFSACVERFGGIDVLLNNAGIGEPTTDLSEAPLDKFERMFDTNVKGVFLCAREALKIMRPRKSGHILTVISMAGLRTNPVAPVYCASKFGARGLSSGLADQVLAEGIKVTDLNPGPVDTDYWGDRPVPREKFLKAEEVADVILFVLSQPEHVLIREINFDNIAFFKK